MSTTFNGIWYYRSFYNASISIAAGAVVGSPKLAEPWTPLARLDVSTDAAGTVRGKLTFPQGVVLEIEGRVTEVPSPLPSALWSGLKRGVTLTGKTQTSIYQLQGWFVPDENQVVGSIVSVQNDIGRQPDGTSGHFILVRKSE